MIMNYGDLYKITPKAIRQLLKPLITRKAKERLAHDLIDKYIISFPKCGRTWLRMMIGYAFNSQFNLNLKVEELTEIHSITKTIDRDICPTIKFSHDDRPNLKFFDEIDIDKYKYSNQELFFLI